MVTDVFVHSSAEMGKFRKTDGYPPNSGYWEYSFALWQGIVDCPAQWQFSVDSLHLVSDILYGGTCGAGFEGWGPLRVTLPMKVVMVSIYVMPVISSFTMWLELTQEIPGVATSLMGIAPTGTLRSTSMNSGVCKQAVTPEKPCSRVGGHTSTKACVGGEG